MTRHYNFCAGPAALPLAVLERAQEELLDYRGRGLSVMEMSHRSDEFIAIAERAEADFRQLLNVASNYRVLFLQGGASMQFAMLPMNLLGRGGSGNFIQTGIWGKKALSEAKRLGFASHVAASSEANGHVAVPAWTPLALAMTRPICTTRRTRPLAVWSLTTRPVCSVPMASACHWSVICHPISFLGPSR